MEEERYVQQEHDDMEQAIKRFAFEEEYTDEDCIRIDVLYQILDHFVPQWRKRTDRKYKLKKFVTEQQLDTNLSKTRNYIDIQIECLRKEITAIKETKDEMQASLAELNRIKESEFETLEKQRSELRKLIFNNRNRHI